MSELDNKIRDLESQLTALKDERERRMGIEVGEMRALSPELRAVLAARNWWTDESDNDYDPFRVHQISEHEIFISGKNGGATSAPTKLVLDCIRVTE
jgi:hypothetical protein